MRVARELPEQWVERLRSVLPSSLKNAPMAPLGAGLDCWAIQIGADTVVRIPQHDEATAAIDRDAEFLGELAAVVPVPIPEPRFVVPNPLGPGNLGGYRLVPGRVFDDVQWLEHGLLSASNAEIVASIIAALGRFPVERAVELGVPGKHYRSVFLADRDRVQREVASVLPEDLGSALMERWGVHAVPVLTDPRRSLLHGDISLDHLLIDPESGAISGLIDFGDVCVGSPDLELTYLWADAGPEFVELVCGPVDQPLADRLEFLALADDVADALWAVDHHDAALRDEAIGWVTARLARS